MMKKFTFEIRPIAAIHCGLLALGMLLWPQSTNGIVPFDLLAAALVLMSHFITLSMFVATSGLISPAWRLKVRLILIFGFATATLGSFSFPDDISHYLLLTGAVSGFFTTLILHEQNDWTLRRRVVL